MSLFSFQKQKDETISAVFEIGSGSVAGALVKLSSTEHPQLLYSYREAIPFQENLEHDRLVADMILAVEHVAKNLGDDGLVHLNFTGYRRHRIHDIFYSFASPWVLSQTTVLDIKKETETVITKQLLDDLVAREQHSFEKLIKEGDSSSVFDSDALMIEKKMIQVRLNGYPTDNPYKKTAHQIETAFCMSFVPADIMQKINTAVEKTFNFRKVTPHSFALLSYSALRDLFHTERDFIFVDVHGELTDVLVVKNGLLAHTFSFPFGTHTLIRKASRLLNLMPELAESSLRIHALGKNDDATKAKIAPLLQIVQKEWLTAFTTAYTALPEKIALPHTFFVITDTDLEVLFADVLKTGALPGISMTASSPNIITLDDATLAMHCRIGRRLVPDAPLLLQAVALNTFAYHQKNNG
ncbi:hypothetical protein EPO17_02410 [Patescibacteria group bacterium]|nr:MAG: hypothetical protein EPO17_02410 [Patescibacteria group bacterium]